MMKEFKISHGDYATATNYLCLGYRLRVVETGEEWEVNDETSYRGTYEIVKHIMRLYPVTTHFCCRKG